jgi:hypothetical protein
MSTNERPALMTVNEIVADSSVRLLLADGAQVLASVYDLGGAPSGAQLVVVPPAAAPAPSPESPDLPPGVRAIVEGYGEAAVTTYVTRGARLPYLVGEWQRKVEGREGQLLRWEDLDQHSGTGKPFSLFEVRRIPVPPATEKVPWWEALRCGRTLVDMNGDPMPAPYVAERDETLKAGVVLHAADGSGNTALVSPDGRVEVLVQS